jgi:hypothetical protein
LEKEKKEVLGDISYKKTCLEEVGIGWRRMLKKRWWGTEDLVEMGENISGSSSSCWGNRISC